VKRSRVAALIVAICALGAKAQTATSVPVYVKETAGIRRTAYPVNARIPFPKGALPDPARVRLAFNSAEVPVQFTPEARWPDGSVQWLDADFNVTIGPNENRTYTLEYGSGISSQAQPRGLSVTEDAESIRVGNVRFSKTGFPLITSVKYRGEDIGNGANGISVTDSAGGSHDLSRADALKTEIVKRGPLDVLLRYSGRLMLDGANAAPFVITVEMPNSKSWMKVTAVVQDPAMHVRDLALDTPFSFSGLPLIWDFGTERWTYGVLRAQSERVTLTEAIKPDGATEWSVSTGETGQEQLYDTATSSRPVAWAHLQDSKEAVAFAIESAESQPGTYRFSIDGQGHTSIRFAPAHPANQHQLIVYEHFVPTPVQIGAATSPASALNPLIAVCDRERYVSSGVETPTHVEAR